PRDRRRRAQTPPRGARGARRRGGRGPHRRRRGGPAGPRRRPGLRRPAGARSAARGPRTRGAIDASAGSATTGETASTSAKRPTYTGGVTDAAKQPTIRETHLSKTYAPAEVEARRYAKWVADGRFKASDDSGRDPYCVVIPPPNVTGRLHLGHALNHTLIDAMVRRERMRGKEALFLPGTDHAGISTQNV